jgi:hypothetical protein
MNALQNSKNLPVARVDQNKFPCFLNPEILEWVDVGHGRQEGRGLVWVDPNMPINVLEQNILKTNCGELKFSQAKVGDVYGPLMIEPKE